jgi:hypothetical protein
MRMNLPIEQLQVFIVHAKATTYVGKGTKTLPYRPEAYELQYREDDFFYIDSYFGGSDFIGQETVYFQNKPVWAMNYYGRLLRPDLINAEEAGLVIQESLSAMYQEGRFLGGFHYQTKLGDYTDTSQGDFTTFTGTEWIDRNGEKVYELVYHGGLIRD